jgi:hypothetical protein
MTAGGLMLRRGEADGVDDKGSREFVTLWVSESQARERMNLESLSHFVAAVAREVRDRVDDATDAGPLGDGELDVACALLPNGRLLLDVQLLPQSAVPAWVGSLEQRLSELALPPVRTSPVAFSFRISLGKGVGDAQLPFRVPFTRWAEDWSGGSLDQLIRAAAAQRGLWTGDGDWPVIQRATLEGAHLVTTPAERSLGLDRPLPEDSSPLTPTPPSDVLDRNSRSALAQRLTQRLAAYPLLLRARIVWRRFRQWVRAQMQRWHYPRPDAAGESSVVAETTVGSLVSSTVGSSRSLADATDSGEELEARAADDDSRDEGIAVDARGPRCLDRECAGENRPLPFTGGVATGRERFRGCDRRLHDDSGAGWARCRSTTSAWGGVLRGRKHQRWPSPISKHSWHSTRSMSPLDTTAAFC